MILSKTYIAGILPNVAPLKQFNNKRMLNVCHEFVTRTFYLIFNQGT